MLSAPSTALGTQWHLWSQISPIHRPTVRMRRKVRVSEVLDFEASLWRSAEFAICCFLFSKSLFEVALGRYFRPILSTTEHPHPSFVGYVPQVVQIWACSRDRCLSMKGFLQIRA